MFARRHVVFFFLAIFNSQDELRHPCSAIKSRIFFGVLAFIHSFSKLLILIRVVGSGAGQVASPSQGRYIQKHSYLGAI